MYLLVEFTDEKNVAVIPENWLDGNSCAVWPDKLKGPGRMNKAVLEKVPPEDSWPAYPIRELYRNASFIEVRKRLRKAEEMSDLLTTADDTDEEPSSRKSKRKKRALVYSEDEDFEHPVQPRLEQTSDMPQHARDESSDDESISEVANLPVKPKAPIPPRGNFGQKSPQVGKRPCVPVSGDLSPTLPVSRQCTQNPMIARDARLFTCLEKLIHGQEEIKVMLGQVSAALTSLTATNISNVGGGQEFSKPDDLDLPVQSPEMMEHAELMLEKKEVFQGLVNYLTLLGGKNVADGARRSLSTVLSNDMATKYNWYGLKGKQAFGKLKLCAAVQKAVLKSCKCYASEFEKECREWLRTASDRDGGRKKRKNASVLLITNDDN